MLIQKVADASQSLSSVPEEPSPSYAAAFSRQESSFTSEEPITAANIDDTIVSTDLHATSEALNMLSHAAQLDSYATRSQVPDRPIATPGNVPLIDRSRFEFQYPLIAKGLLTIDQVAQLVAR